jgi:hypothetical protein
MAERRSAVRHLPAGSQPEHQAGREEHRADGKPQSDHARLNARRVGRTDPADPSNQEHPDGPETDEAARGRDQSGALPQQPGPHQQTRKQGERPGQQVGKGEEPAEHKARQQRRPRPHLSHLPASTGSASVRATAAAVKEPDPGAWATSGRDTDLALLVLRNRRRDPCAERIAIELDRRRTPAERAAISEDQAEALKGVIEAVLDGVGLTTEQRERAIEIAVRELRRVGGEEP